MKEISLYANYMLVLAASSKGFIYSIDMHAKKSNSVITSVVWCA